MYRDFNFFKKEIVVIICNYADFVLFLLVIYVYFDTLKIVTKKDCRHAQNICVKFLIVHQLLNII